MTHLIDKDALVAEIKRLIDCCYKICAGNLDFLQKSYPERYYSIETYKEILSFINSLEVKEVDLEKEIKEVQRDFKTIEEYEGYPCTMYASSIEWIAKHFFELGMQQSKNYNNNEE